MPSCRSFRRIASDVNHGPFGRNNSVRTGRSTTVRAWRIARSEGAADLGARVEVEADQDLAEVELDGLDLS